MVKRRITSIILLAGLVAGLTAGCTPNNKVTTEQLAGNYTTVSGYDATEIILSKTADHQLEFNSFLLGRPYESGTWELQGKDLIVHVNENNTYTYKQVSLKNDVLSFLANGNAAQFIKTPDSTAGTNPARVESLTDLLIRASRAVDQAFPAPVPAGFEWRLENGDTAQVQGYQTRAVVLIKSDFSLVNQIGELLAAEGFASDVYNTSEIVSGFIKDREVFLVTISSDPENEQSCVVEINCGALPETNGPGQDGRKQAPGINP